MGNRIYTIDRICELHQLILHERTGTPAQLADKFQISRTQLYKLMSILKDFGLDIKYDRTHHTFHYVE